MQEERLYYTVRETAKLLRLTPVTVYRNTESGKIPCKRAGKRVLIPVSYIRELDNPEIYEIKNIIIGRSVDENKNQ